MEDYARHLHSTSVRSSKIIKQTSILFTIVLTFQGVGKFMMTQPRRLRSGAWCLAIDIYTWTRLDHGIYSAQQGKYKSKRAFKKSNINIGNHSTFSKTCDFQTSGDPG